MQTGMMRVSPMIRASTNPSTAPAKIWAKINMGVRDLLCSGGILFDFGIGYRSSRISKKREVFQIPDYLHLAPFLDDLRDTIKIHKKANNYHIEDREVSDEISYGVFGVNDNSDRINIGIDHETPVFFIESYSHMVFRIVHMYSPLREYLKFEYTG